MIINEILKRVPLNKNFDLYLRNVIIDNKKSQVLFFSSITDNELLLEMIKSLRSIKKDNKIIFELNNIKVKETIDCQELIDCLYDAEALVFIDGYEKVIHVDCKKLPSRSLSEPEAEKTVRGSRDGFNEQLVNNIALIRMRIKSPYLRVENHKLSSYSKMNVCLVYLEDQVSKNVLKNIENRLKSVKIDSLIMTDRALEEKMFEQEGRIFPLVRYTERPDVACIHLMNKKILIMVDTSASIIITPITLIDHTKHVEEFRQAPVVGFFTKFLRTISMIVSIFMVPIYFLMTTSTTMINLFVFSIDSASRTVLGIQFILASLILEVYRIAVIHTPNSMVSGISLVSAVILGDVSLKVGLFSEEVLLITTIASVCGFATPSYELSLSNRIVSVGLLIISFVFGIPGFLIVLLALILYLASINVLGMPYLYPLLPFDYKEVKNIVLRGVAKNRKKV